MERKIPLNVTNITMRTAVQEKTDTVFVRGRDFFSLTYRENGKITIKSAWGDLTSGAGSITYIPRGLSYETEILEGGQMHILHVWTADAGAPFGEKPLSVAPDNAAQFLEDFCKARTQFESEGVGFSCLSAVFRILSMAEKAFRPAAESPNPQLRRAKKVMDERFADATLRVGELAALRGVSEVYFRREFRRFYGVSPLEYIKAKRVDAAKRLLETGLYSVTDAALSSGFESVSYFSAEFRRLAGISPSAYVKSLEK